MIRHKRFFNVFILSTYAVIYLAKEAVQDGQEKSHHHEEKIPIGSSEFYMYILYSLLIVIFAGLMSGLTVGYNSIDFLHLELVMNGGTDEEI